MQYCLTILIMYIFSLAFIFAGTSHIAHSAINDYFQDVLFKKLSCFYFTILRTLIIEKFSDCLVLL